MSSTNRVEAPVQDWSHYNSSYHNKCSRTVEHTDNVRLSISHFFHVKFIKMHIRSTLASSVPASGSTSATTTQQGPVAQPAPTTGTPGAPTPYTYTTVINGVTTAVADVFTPTSPPTVSVSPSSTGIVWSYSSWLSVYGPPKTRSSAISCSALSSSAVLVAMAAVTRWLWAA